MIAFVAGICLSVATRAKPRPDTLAKKVETRPVLTLLLPGPGPTVAPGKEWRDEVVKVDKPIPDGSAEGIESEILFKENAEGTPATIIGGDVRVWITHPRHADLKIVVTAYGKNDRTKVLATEVLWDGPSIARGLSIADADKLEANPATRVNALLSVPGARRWRLNVSDMSKRSSGQLHEWELKFRVGRVPFAHDQAYYRRLLHGGDGLRDPRKVPNVADYYREVSDGKFTISDPGSHGPLTWEGWDSASEQERCAAASRLLEDQGVEFRRFDTNHDGIVSVYELTILVIHNDREVGVGRMATDANGTVLPKSGLRAAPGIVFVPHRVDFESLTHELSHALSPRIHDLYGELGNSAGLTLMSATLGNPADDKKSLYLDAWHRVRIGWITKGFAPGPGGAGGAIELASTVTARERGVAPAVLLIRRLDIKGSESFIFEYRDGSGYDNGVGDRGIVAWHASEDEGDKPAPPKDGSAEAGNAVYAVGPDLAKGARQAWKPSNGKFRLHWADGTMLSQVFWVEAAPTGEGSAILKWNAAQKSDIK
jgi:M6 family metalloprotease-like protein